MICLRSTLTFGTYNNCTHTLGYQTLRVVNYCYGLGNGVPIESVSKMMGHTNIKTTQIYARITDQKVNNDMAILASKLDGRYDDLLPEESSKTKHAPDKRKEIKAWAQERNMTV